MTFVQKIKDKSWLIITVLLIVLFILAYSIESIFITIYPGKAGVLFKRIFNQGTVMDKTFDEGLNIIFPWDKMYIYDIRFQEKKQTVNVLSQNGLTIEVVVSIRYYLVSTDLPILHKIVGPDYMDKIIIPSIISSVREVVGGYLPEEIYTTARHLIQDKLIVEVIEETGRVPVVYDTIIVESIVLPELINNAIELKLKQQQEFLEYEFRIKKAEQEIDRKKKEALGIKQYQNIIAESLSPELLQWKGIMATLELAQSPNTKVIIVGGGENGLPIIFNADSGGYSAIPENSKQPDYSSNTSDFSDNNSVSSSFNSTTDSSDSISGSSDNASGSFDSTSDSSSNASGSSKSTSASSESASGFSNSTSASSTTEPKR